MTFDKSGENKMVKKGSIDKTDKSDKIGGGEKTPIECIKESDEQPLELGETKLRSFKFGFRFC